MKDAVMFLSTLQSGNASCVLFEHTESNDPVSEGWGLVGGQGWE